MKKTTDNRGRLLRVQAAGACLFLALLQTACVPPPATDAGLAKELGLLKQQQRQQQQTLEFIQQQLAQLHEQTGVPAADSAESVAEPQPDLALPPDASEVEDLVAVAGGYLEAFSALTLGRHEQARSGFSTFLQNFGDHRFAPDARYWLAESELALGLLQQAEENLLTVAADPAAQSKAPAALLRLVELYRQQERNEPAEDMLRQLRSRFPESQEAQHFNRSDQAQ
jgi:tol-pal system protein YbgF